MQFVRHRFLKEGSVNNKDFEILDKLLKEEHKIRKEKGLLDKPGYCEFNCPICGNKVASSYCFVRGETYLHGGCYCSNCKIGIRI